MGRKKISTSSYRFALKLLVWRKSQNSRAKKQNRPHAAAWRASMPAFVEPMRLGVAQTKQSERALPGHWQLIKAKTAVIDGEAVALDHDGSRRFDAPRSRRRNCCVVLFAFDLLYLDPKNETLRVAHC